MSRFIQLLESRTLLSVTTATLLADEALIVADAATAKADLRVLAAAVRADTKTITADLKGTPKTNLPLLHTLKTDEAKALAVITKDLNALLNPGVSLSRRSTAAGVAQIHKGTAAVEAKVAADVAALQTVTTAPLATIQADDQGNTIGTDLQALVTANPSDTTLATDVSKQETDTNTGGATFNTAAVKFQTDIGTLATDLAGAPAGIGGTGGTGGTTIPNLVGTLTGSATSTSGNHVGRVSTLTVNITSEGTDGSLTGNISITNTGNGTNTATLTGSVTASHVFTATLVDTGGNTTTLHATVSGKTISGTYSGTNDSGTFHVTLQ